MLKTFDADVQVQVAEREVRKDGFTLGPAAVWGRDQSIRDWVMSRRALRLNPALGRIEDIAGGFTYDGGATISAPREACGPELRTLLYDRPAQVRAIELRLLPLLQERWIKLAAKDADQLYACMKRIVHRGVFCRALWTELATGYLCFSGALSDSFVQLSTDIAGDAGVHVGDAVPPRGLELMKPVVPEIKTWTTLGTRDALLLGDPWAVLVA